MSTLAIGVSVSGPAGGSITITGPVGSSVAAVAQPQLTAFTGYTPISVATNAGLRPHLALPLAAGVTLTGTITQ